MTIAARCVEHWQKGDRMGYGTAKLHGKCIKLHRKVFMQTHGYLPPVVMHSCDNPRCINPEHLLPGTHTLNMRDMAQKGRHGPNRTCGERHYAMKLTDAQIAEIQAAYIPKSKDRGQVALARKYGVHQSAISLILSGKRRKYLNLKGECQ